MLLRNFCGVLLCLVPLVLAGPIKFIELYQNDVSEDGPKQWWQTASFYQIYPRSFKDSDGDGIGDLKGITQKLPYLKEIGITATWLSPIFKSPMKDFGYDISNFKEIQKEYGTMDDFKDMIEKAKSLGIKIILDFVPNHSSDKHDWFVKSVNYEENPRYKDFYVWHKGKPGNNPDKNDPPNNWLSVFRGSAWKWNEKRKEYYLHQFAEQQPDLNYNNEEVKAEMKDVLKFWLDKGVYGFRIDAVPHIFECDNFPDEPVNPDVTDEEDWAHLKHECTVDQKKTLDMVYEWRKFLDDYTTEAGDNIPRIMMTEAYSRPEILKQYYESTDKTKEGSHIPFNFWLITDLNKDSNAKKFEEVIKKWMTNMPTGKTPNWVLGNHDQHRVATRYGVEKKDIMNVILLSLPGASVSYNGEEIGMTNVWISWEQTKDPAGRNAGPDNYEKSSRDPERTPFQWNAQKNAGFSTADKTWLPVSPNFKEVNVARQRGIARSTLNIYKDMQNLRRLPAFTDGKMEVKALTDNVLAIVRTTGQPGADAYVTLANFGNKREVVSLAELKDLSNQLTYKIVTDRSVHRIGDTSSKSVILWPYEAAVLSCAVPPPAPTI